MRVMDEAYRRLVTKQHLTLADSLHHVLLYDGHLIELPPRLFSPEPEPEEEPPLSLFAMELVPYEELESFSSSSLLS